MMTTKNTPADPTQAPTGTYLDRFFGRYELSDDSHHKFWECLCDNPHSSAPSAVLRWGRIGAKKPQSMRVPMHEASWRAQKKMGEGYRFINGSNKSYSQYEKDLLHQSLKEDVKGRDGSSSHSAKRRKM